METSSVIIPKKNEPGEVFYPEPDGEPMAETEKHVMEMLDIIQCLRDFFDDKPDIYVCANMLMYYRKGDPSCVVSPDIFVVKGISKQMRRTYKIWEEGKAPDVIIELTSETTKSKDFREKKKLYQEEFKTREYYIYDPYELELKGYRLVKGKYTEMPLKEGRIYSKELGLELAIHEGRLRLFHEGNLLLNPVEKTVRIREQARQLMEIQEELRKRDELIEVLKAELEKRR